MGASWSGDRFLGARSPVHQALEADAPILLIHGKDDTVVPITESENMDAALSRANKVHSFVRLNGEDHGLSSPGTRTQMLEAAVDFVVAHDPPA
ncbi:prolyl oligopeptidase family serine peptidase [Caulobacter sp. S45]|uniref:alpha/beta hydrolase family protein n=1 Tax=Caulobacter sp. S45 TaxID=1641861 RepID=UPI001576911D